MVFLSFRYQRLRRLGCSCQQSADLETGQTTSQTVRKLPALPPAALRRERLLQQGLCSLCRYLQEVGYTDTILDVRTQRVRSLLGLSASEQNGSVENKNLQHLINGTERRKDSKRCTQRLAQTPGLECALTLNVYLMSLTEFLMLRRSPGDVLETFNFLENAEDSDEDEDDEGDLMDDISTDKHHRNKKHKTKVFRALALPLGCSLFFE